MKELLQSQASYEAEAKQHYADLLANSLRIETPDSVVNKQWSWAQIALDQAWVCNDVLGCGLVGGYGPSRVARRPQYDWFFAGDGLIAVDALVNSGDYDRAREELAFIAKYQNAASGMVWHEISQSADLADWATKYPYMFVHVDITFDYLIGVGHYVTASGDKQFLKEHWSGIAAAYRYCRSLLNEQDGLPRIPTTKSGVDEQDKMSDDLGLSANWVEASAAFSRMAELAGHAPEAEEARLRSEKARVSAGSRYWNAERNSWGDGYDAAGQPVFRQSTGGLSLLANGILDQRRSDLVLDQLSSADFQTDWGTRGLSASSSEFDPVSYAKGSVWAAGTARVASALWSNHRPATAFPIWSALLPWGTLDSMGHMHEVLAGDFYRPQVESVPEQTWSSATFLSSTVRGLLGLAWNPQANLLEFAPHLPAAWNTISVANIKGRGGKIALRLSRVPGGFRLDADNGGEPVNFHFSPEIPFGARVIGAELSGKNVAVRQEDHAQDEHATLSFSLPAGTSHCLLRFAGGVSVGVKSLDPLEGDASRAPKITAVAFHARSLVVDADISPAQPHSIITLRTEEKPLHAQGATLMRVSDDLYELIADPVPAANGYRHTKITIDFPNKQ